MTAMTSWPAYADELAPGADILHAGRWRTLHAVHTAGGWVHVVFVDGTRRTWHHTREVIRRA